MILSPVGGSVLSTIMEPLLLLTLAAVCSQSYQAKKHVEVNKLWKIFLACS